ncbi:MAG: hypothetical protein R3200_14725 [Xanthomonadales bacterium]|nr:hypothetical protein [Xanthomonadales bacterium]
MKRAVTSCVLLLAVAGSAAADYLVRYDPLDRALYVRACFAPGGSLRLRAADRDAARFLIFARGPGDRWIRNVRHGFWLPASERRRCIRYGVDLARAADPGSLRRAYRVGESFIVWSGTWLWRAPGDAGDEVIIHHPEHFGISAPWELLSRAKEKTVYRLDATPASWNNLVAIGPFEPYLQPAAGSALRVAILNGDPPADPWKIRRWLEGAARSVGSVYGSMPLESAQVLVVPIGRGREPVPWAQVRRGGGTAVHLFINQEEPLEAFMDDWTAAHEFSHLLHPFLGASGRWLAEGLASYYQNIGRARAGLLSDRAAWEKLHAGFRRGQKNTGSLTLRQANKRMHDERKYMRVYWSGAAYALATDVELRLYHGTSLDEVLAAFRKEHLPAQRLWDLKEFLAELDRISETGVFLRNYNEVIDSRSFPDLTATYRALGIKAADDQLYLGHSPDAVALRRELVEPVAIILSRN